MAMSDNDPHNAFVCIVTRMINRKQHNLSVFNYLKFVYTRDLASNKHLPLHESLVCK